MCTAAAVYVCSSHNVPKHYFMVQHLLSLFLHLWIFNYEAYYQKTNKTFVPSQENCILDNKVNNDLISGLQNNIVANCC